MSRSAAIALAVIAGIIGGLLGAAVLLVGIQRTGRLLPQAASGRPASVSSLPALPAPLPAEESQTAITAIVARVGPAVVNINTTLRPPPKQPTDVLRQLMGLPTEPFPRQGQGSGIIIDGEHGYVLTNAHVVRGADRVEVALADGRSFEASVVGADPLSEIAVVQIPGDDLPVAPLGTTRNLPIGSWVVAIGNPFGLENSITVGVISAKDRHITGPNGVVLQELLQTDASINPGNSGGALIDLQGNVVGIPTAIIPYAQGMGFAVPIDVARQVAERLIATGRMPWLGVGHRSLLPEEAEKLDLPDAGGSLVASVVPGGPADRAGLRAGDVIVRVEDHEVADAAALGSIVRSYDAGTRVRVVVRRGGDEHTFDATLGEVPQEVPGTR